MAAERESRVTEAAAAHALDFERPVIDLERKIEELVRVSGDAPALRPQIRLLEERARELQQEIFADLSAWQKVQLSRHPARPYMVDYVERLFEDFVELHGDRAFADDESIVAGMGGIPTGRFTTPEEVATLIVLLASDRTANVTGSNYVIDGGLIKTT